MSELKTNRRNALLGAAGAAAASIGFIRPTLAAADQKKAITLTATLKIKKGKRKEAIKYLSALTAAVKKNEPGTLAYVAHTYESDSDKVLFFEVYDGREALRKHKPGSYDLGVSGEGLFDGKPKIDMLDRITGYIR